MSQSAVPERTRSRRTRDEAEQTPITPRSSIRDRLRPDTTVQRGPIDLTVVEEIPKELRGSYLIG